MAEEERAPVDERADDANEEEEDVPAWALRLQATLDQIVTAIGAAPQQPQGTTNDAATQSEPASSANTGESPNPDEPQTAVEIAVPEPTTPPPPTPAPAERRRRQLFSKLRNRT